MWLRKDKPGGLWFLVVFGIAWNGLFGVADYALIYLREPTYLSIKAAFLNLTSEQLVQYYSGWPGWARTAWVMNACGGLAGSILLSLGDRSAVWMFALSIVGLLIVSSLITLAPFPRVAGDPWAGSLDSIRNLIAVVSCLHSLAVIVAVRHFLPANRA